MSSAVCATMNWSEETGDGGASIPANKGHVSWSQAHTSDRPVQDGPDSSRSVRFVSLKSDNSKDQFITFTDGGIPENQTPVQDRPDSPRSIRFVSLKSDNSKDQFITFTDGGIPENQTPLQDKRPDSPDSTCHVSKRQERSEATSVRPSSRQHTNLDFVFSLLEEKISIFVKNELKELKEDLRPESSRAVERQRRGAEDQGSEEAGQRQKDREAFLKITLSFLRQMKQDPLADALQSQSQAVVICQQKLKSNFRKKFQFLFEGVAKAGEAAFLEQIYTELSISQACSGEVKGPQEFGETEASQTLPEAPTVTCETLLGPLFRPEPSVRTLLTTGVAGIGKTVLTQKFILDWAQEKAYRGIQLIFPFTFRELSLLREKKYSLVELLHLFFAETKEAEMCRLEDFQVLFVFDGLDENRLRLDFHNSQVVTDVGERTSVEALLTNLIRGTLLPTARLWVTARPAAAAQIPPELVGTVAEVRGFGELQKQEYFSKKVKNREQVRRITFHMEMLRSLRIMCRIPVFCWIGAEVLDYVLTTNNSVPQTLADFYLHFLVVQTKKANDKYHTGGQTDELWNKETKETVFTLGKLAFDHLEKGNVFYESDLETGGIDPKVALIRSGLLVDIGDDRTQLKREKVFSFVHLSIQEFLGALYVLLMFANNGVDLLRKKQPPPGPARAFANLKKLLQKAVDKALTHPNGDLDQFVRFLLGLSLETNQSVLRGLLMKTGTSPQVKNDLVKYIKKRLGDCPSPERSIFLLECLKELNDQSLEEEIQQFLRPGHAFEEKPSPSQWSAVAFILLSSKQQLNIFDLKTFSASDEGLLWLRPVVAASKTALLSDSGLSSRSCQVLVPVLSSKTCSLRELDLSNNDLYDAGVTQLSAGLTSPHCRLDTLRISGCLVGERGCRSLVQALEANPGHLKELDLSFNHPGDAALQELSAAALRPHWKLETLRTDHCGKRRLTPSPRRFFCQYSLDPSTAATNVQLSESKRSATLLGEEQPRPERPPRISSWTRVLCAEAVTGRSYWEAQWNGRVSVGVAYKAARKSEEGYEGCLGWSARSWSLLCSAQGYTAWHNSTPTSLAQAPPPGGAGRVGVYANWASGTVSFYCPPSPSSRTWVHLHTFHSRFTEPLYPAFGFEGRSDSGLLKSWLHLSQVEE